MTSDAPQLAHLITGMRAAYQRGENAMAFARATTGAGSNSMVATLVAYDLQAGSYVAGMRANPDYAERWTRQLADLLAPWAENGASLLEVGCGEATTLAGVVNKLPAIPDTVHGLDLSWSRCSVGRAWLREQGVDARLVVGDLFTLPFADQSIDVVYTSHSLEPNGGREEAALRELLRVARRAVVLVEPIYELAPPEAQARMRSHGYVRDLAATAQSLGARVGEPRLLEHVANPLNPSGVVTIEPAPRHANPAPASPWQCPLTGTPVTAGPDAYVSAGAGLAYPVLRDIPLLRAEHAVVANAIVPSAA